MSKFYNHRTVAKAINPYDIPEFQKFLPREPQLVRAHLSFEGFLDEGGIKVPFKHSKEPLWFFKLRKNHFYRKWNKVQEEYNRFLALAKKFDDRKLWDAAEKYSKEHYDGTPVCKFSCYFESFDTPDEAITEIKTMMRDYPTPEQALENTRVFYLRHWFISLPERTHCNFVVIKNPTYTPTEDDKNLFYAAVAARKEGKIIYRDIVSTRVEWIAISKSPDFIHQDFCSWDIDPKTAIVEYYN